MAPEVVPFADALLQSDVRSGLSEVLPHQGCFCTAETAVVTGSVDLVGVVSSGNGSAAVPVLLAGMPTTSASGGAPLDAPLWTGALGNTGKVDLSILTKDTVAVSDDGTTVGVLVAGESSSSERLAVRSVGAGDGVFRRQDGARVEGFEWSGVEWRSFRVWCGVVWYGVVWD